MAVADNQPIISRPLGNAVWITSFITPNNPDVRLKYEELTEGLYSTEERITALWRYVANFHYNETVNSVTKAGRSTFRQPDTWFYPSETMQLDVSNCANRSFLLASLIKNEIPDVYCSMGRLRLDGIGGHAWVKITMDGEDYILETTQPNIARAILPVSKVTAYEELLAFNDREVLTYSNESVELILNSRFGLCALDFLRDYLCERCLELEV